MEFNKVKVGQKVKFNGFTMKEGVYRQEGFNNWWSEMMTESIGYVPCDKVFEVKSVCKEGIDLKASNMDYDFYYPAECFDLVEDMKVNSPNPHDIPEYKKELLKALLEGKTIQFKANTRGWIDCVYPLNAIEASEQNEVRVKPPEPVVTFKYQVVMSNGYTGEAERTTVKELEEFYSTKDFMYFLKKKFHDGLFVGVEVVQNKLAEPTSTADAVTKSYIDSSFN